MTSGSLTLSVHREGSRVRLEETWNYTTAVKQTKKCTIYRAVKSFLNCNAKGTCSSQVTEAAAASHRAQWWSMSCSRHKHVPLNQLLAGAACLSRGSPLLLLVLPSPKLWAQHPELSHPELSPTHHSMSHWCLSSSLLLCLYSAQSKEDRAILPCEIMDDPCSLFH